MDDTQAAASAASRRDLLIGGACCAGALLGSSASVWNAPRTLPQGGLDALIPKQIGTWSLVSTYGVVVGDGGDEARGPYDDLLTRIYQSNISPPITLLVAYVGSQRADIRLHRPEGCYPAAGFTLSDREIVRLTLTDTPAISAQTSLATSLTRSERLLYWTRVGTQFPTSSMAQRQAYLRAFLAGSVPDGVLVRVSVPGSDGERAWAAFHDFLKALLAGSSSTAVQVLFGGRP